MEGMKMYESPIKIIESTIDNLSKAIIKQRDDAIFAEIQSSFGVDVDKEELIRALKHDRNQYDKGYADGKRDAMDGLVRCMDCKHRTSSEFCECRPGDFFCADGEKYDPK
jgi:hypothetical protein